jgi:hypothetical protein
MASIIHPLYSFWFTTVDPLLAVTAIITNLFFPSSNLLSLTPRALPPRPETTILLVTTAGAYGCLLIIHLFILRPRPGDIAMWKSIQAGQTLFEASKLTGVFWAIGVGGGISTQVWVNICITAGLIVFRTAFVLGLGEGKDKSV